MGQVQALNDNDYMVDCDIRSPKELIRLKIPHKFKRKKVMNSVKNIGVTIIQNKREYIIWSPLDKSDTVYELLSDLRVDVIGGRGGKF